MFREVDIIVNLHDLVVWASLGLGAMLAAALLVTHRRRMWLWRRMWGHTWYSREYFGETTWFPTYRKRLGYVWVTALEESRDCYRSGAHSTKETGRRSRMDEAEAKIRERRERAQDALELETGAAVSLHTVRDTKAVVRGYSSAQN